MVESVRNGSKTVRLHPWKESGNRVLIALKSLGASGLWRRITKRSEDADRWRTRLEPVLVTGARLHSLRKTLSAILLWAQGLLMGAGLFVHTLLNLNRIPLDFESNRIMLFRLSVPRTRCNDAR